MYIEDLDLWVTTPVTATRCAAMASTTDAEGGKKLKVGSEDGVCLLGWNWNGDVRSGCYINVPEPAHKKHSDGVERVGIETTFIIFISSSE